ncbi:hypothetical protein [Actinomadura harenae]|uniref:Uncharacterized protein n=1 Tax=Actinomadura harenae TaxID=2483351 RepID=A0A3M2M753_9ACTN|nr:hypothetical protein [Actinomadura harenae]RMI45299.1 hypothetical protein EBO15_10255 [Actinomadura harenae]
MQFTRTRRATSAPVSERPPFVLPTTSAMPVQPATITPRLRDRVLDWASRITADTADEAEVLAHAEAILEYLELADTSDDLDIRVDALARASINRGYPHDGDTIAFLSYAGYLYGFLADAQDPTFSPCDIGSDPWRRIESTGPKRD